MHEGHETGLAWSRSLALMQLQMTKDSRTLSLEIDADSQNGTPRDPRPDRAAAGSRQAAPDDAPQLSEGWVPTDASMFSLVTATCLHLDHVSGILMPCTPKPGSYGTHRPAGCVHAQDSQHARQDIKDP